jgi:ribonuclease P protein subunit RPR2
VIRDKGLEKEIAEERIDILFDLAVKEAGNKNGLSKRYVSLLKKISSHYKTSIPKKIKMSICKSCGDVIVPGVSGKVRLASSPRRIIYICGRCKNQNSFIY